MSTRNVTSVASVAIVGAGLAGSACAQALARAGLSVTVFDKSRGPGGRLATRRAEWVDAAGQARTSRFDHGAVGFAAHGEDFQTAVHEAVQAGVVSPWRPRLAPGSAPLEGDGRFYLPTPDMPAWCRQLLSGMVARWSVTVDRLRHTDDGWQLEAGGTALDGRFDAVVLALPPAQAAPLLSPHRRDWSRHAALALMQPCWTLMGVTTAASPEPAWDLAQPQGGPLAWVMRTDARPGRERVPGLAHWVAHARAGWSRRHLELPADQVLPLLQQALQEAVREAQVRDEPPLPWLYAVAHRWRYAVPATARPASPELCWWDAPLGLGVCGDFLLGCGAEGAWRSGRGLASLVMRSVAVPAASASTARAA